MIRPATHEDIPDLVDMGPSWISVNDAMEYFRHPSQQIEGITPEKLPKTGVEYLANGPVCGAFNLGPWPDVWMGHYAVKPEGWGRAVVPALKILNVFWREKMPARIIGWTPESNRAALAFAKRLGFEIDGEMNLGNRVIVMQGWRPEWA